MQLNANNPVHEVDEIMSVATERINGVVDTNYATSYSVNEPTNRLLVQKIPAVTASSSSIFD
jgi:hypothetical protein